ncbi:MAG: EAL domain-containing protein [Clostridiales bacterium]|nr:EAL domain-containing protein [Clostridiales bacterium]
MARRRNMVKGQNMRLPYHTAGVKIQRSPICLGALIVTVFFLGGLYLHFSWRRYTQDASSQAMMVAQSLGSVLHSEHIAMFSGSMKDLELPEYDQCKKSLIRLVETTNPIHAANVMGQRDGRLILMVDSEAPGSASPSLPGQVYDQTDDVFWEPFRSGETILTDPVTDRRGEWISALVPIKDAMSEAVIAVFRVDYSAAEWFSHLRAQMIPDLMIVLCAFGLLGALLFIGDQRSLLKALNRQLAFDEALYHSVFDQVPVGIAILNDKSFVHQSEFGSMTINPMFEKIIGRTRQDLENVNWTDITHPEDLPAELEQFERFRSGDSSGYTMEKRFIRPDGSSVWTNMLISPFLSGEERSPLHICLLEDITVRRASEESFRESERSKSVLLSHLPGLAYRCHYDRQWTMQFISDGCLELTGYAPESLLYNKEHSFNDLIVPEFREALWMEWARILPQRRPFRFEYEIYTADHMRKWVLELGQGIYNAHGEVEALEGIIMDISDRKEMERRLRYIGEYDSWTGLRNRAYLENLLSVDNNRPSIHKRAVVCINLSSTQSVTTAFGFHYTLELIKKTASALEEYSTDSCMLFKTYENRFAYYIRGYGTQAELLQFCESVAGTLEHLLMPERVGGGIGVLEIDDEHPYDVDQLLKKVLIASEKAINSGDREFEICIYDAMLESQIDREHQINLELSEIALGEGNGGLFLQYQPILDFQSDQICGFEALARVRSDTLGLIPPLEFIPIAEKTRLIIPIGYKIISQALLFVRNLLVGGYETVSVAVNISIIQLLKDGFCDRLMEIVHEMQMDPSRVHLEITESVFAGDYEKINRVLWQLKNAGFHIAIDDFGTGFSSLAREGELNVDCLKIDKHFLDHLPLAQPDQSIIGDIISMAHKFGHSVVAEGVEHPLQKQYLKKCGCDKMQGYLLSKPLDEESAVGLLQRQGSAGNSRSNP